MTNDDSRIAVLNMATVVVTPHTVVLAASQHLGPALRLAHLPH